MTKMPSIHFYLPAELKERLEQRAKEEYTSVAKTIGRAIEFYLDNSEVEIKVKIVDK